MCGVLGLSPPSGRARRSLDHDPMLGDVVRMRGIAQLVDDHPRLLFDGIRRVTVLSSGQQPGHPVEFLIENVAALPWPAR